ncbi:hypothetical protein CPB84DRAFT_618620 [Gymnopilus junonius]|uniref:Secreted protein n=1 Tax=Gymnopilus junonius TaxID=109634 RepID=A0A9P5NSX4_GYMJU|nr:hypothetical protein CPB84DRAFT_618620 [Gymnopilus junonius]
MTWIELAFLSFLKAGVTCNLFVDYYTGNSRKNRSMCKALRSLLRSPIWFRASETTVTRPPSPKMQDVTRRTIGRLTPSAGGPFSLQTTKETNTKTMGGFGMYWVSDRYKSSRSRSTAFRIVKNTESKLTWDLWASHESR